MKMKRSSLNVIASNAMFRNQDQMNDSDDSDEVNHANAKKERLERRLSALKESGNDDEISQAMQQEEEEDTAELQHLVCPTEANLNNAEIDFLNQRKLQLCGVQSLQTQCLKCVAYNFPFYTCFDDPFGHLSNDSLILLATYLNSIGLLDSPDVLPFLVTKNLRSLDVILVSGPRLSPVRSAAYWTSDRVHQLFDKMIDKCSGTLKTLNLNLQHRGFLLQVAPDQWMPVPSLYQVNKLLSGMGSLTELILRSANIGDTTLAVIGATCTNLTLLDLFDNDGVTNFGLSILLPSNPSPADNNNADYKKAGCSHLKFLGLHETSVTIKGVVMALAEFPHLTRIDHPEVNAAIIKYLNDFHKTRVNIECLNLVCKNNAEKLEPRSLQTLCLSISNMKSLTIDYGEFDLQVLRHVKNLENLMIDCNFQFRPSRQLTSFIMKNYQLTKLHISGLDVSLDLSIIGFYCLNLEVLFWYNNQQVYDHPEYLLNEQVHFTNLKMLSIDCNEGVRIEKMPSSILICMLSSKKLEIVVLKHLLLHYGVMKQVNMRARQEIGGVYSNLRSINVATSVFHIELLKEIFFIAPYLQQVVMSIAFVGNQEVNPSFEEIRYLAHHLGIRLAVE